MSVNEVKDATKQISMHLEKSVSHGEKLVNTLNKLGNSFLGGGGGGGGSMMSDSLGGFSSSPYVAPMATTSVMPQSQAPITTPPPGNGRQGFQMGIGMQGMPTSGQGGILNSAMGGAFLGSSFGGTRMGGLMMGLGALGATGGVLLRATGSGLPDVEETIGRATNYYQASVRNARGMREYSSVTRNALGEGLTSRGSDAMVAAILSNQGMVFSSDPNSTYMQTLTGVSNAAKYLNMDNAAAAMALEGMTSGAGSMNMLTQFGIHTSDPRTGKAYTQSQIFEQVAQRLTAGRGQATVDETLESIRRGNLGETIRNIGLSTDQQEMLKQYMIERAQGRYMDLTDADVMRGFEERGGPLDRENPQLAGMAMNADDTRMMQDATADYIQGMQEAAETLKDINAVLELVPGAFRRLEAQFSGLQGSQGGRFIEEFVNAMPGALSGFAALVGLTTGSSALAGVALSLGAEGPGFTPGGPGAPSESVSVGDLGPDAPNFQKPHGGPISSPRGHFGAPRDGRTHQGVDYVGGGTVSAAADGVVSKVGSNLTGTNGYGHYIYIEHSGGYETLYAHLASRPSLSAGTRVTAGQAIGVMGNTGTSTGTHLHFEVRKNGTPINPESVVGASGRSGGGSGGSGQGAEMHGAMGSLSNSPLSTPMTVVGNSTASVFGGSSGSGSSVSSISALSGNSSMPGLYLSGAPSAKTGDAYVANDGPVNVHAGEAILTAEQADDWRAMMRGERRGGGNHVTINVNLSNSSDSEARRLATMVKYYLEEDSLIETMGRK
jgi:murein DD-endopeptidase MepM/ murein hydrolase activator NlpD